MPRGVLQWLTALFGGGGGEGDEADEEAEESGFVPSVLDASVRYAHGMSRSSAERELANVEEKARILEEHRRNE